MAPSTTYTLGLVRKPPVRGGAHLLTSGSTPVLGGDSATEEQSPGDVALHRSGQVQHKLHAGDISFLLLTRTAAVGVEDGHSPRDSSPARCLTIVRQLAREHVAEDTDDLVEGGTGWGRGWTPTSRFQGMPYDPLPHVGPSRFHHLPHRAVTRNLSPQHPSLRETCEI